MTKNFFQVLSQYQKAVDKELKLFFDLKIKKEKKPVLRDIYKFLKEFSLRSGKRIRPILVNYGYFLAGEK